MAGKDACPTMPDQATQLRQLVLERAEPEPTPAGNAQGEAAAPGDGPARSPAAARRVSRLILAWRRFLGRCTSSGQGDSAAR
jgi:hypothetical protein